MVSVFWGLIPIAWGSTLEVWRPFRRSRDPIPEKKIQHRSFQYSHKIDVLFGQSLLPH